MPVGNVSLGRGGFARLLVLVGRSLQRVRRAARDHEHEGAKDEHDAHEGGQLAGPREDQAEHGQDPAQRIDDEHGVAMAEAQVEQPMVEVASVGREGRLSRGEAADDDPEGVDDGHAEDEQRDGHLGGAQDGQHGQGEADQVDAGRADEDARRMEVAGQEAEQRAGQDGAQQRDLGLVEADRSPR